MADKNAEIQALQAVVAGPSAQSCGNRIHGLVFGSKGLQALADKYAAHAEVEMGWVEKFANRILDLGGDLKIEATPEIKVYDDIVEYLKSEKKISEEGIAQVTEMMPVFAEDFVAYEDMKAYLIDDQDDGFDFESVPRSMADFDARIDRLAESVRFIVHEALVLSNEGCSRCARCTWPDAPCRFPEKLHPSIEGFGLVVNEVAEDAGIRYNNGPKTVTFFGGVLY